MSENKAQYGFKMKMTKPLKIKASTTGEAMKKFITWIKKVPENTDIIIEGIGVIKKDK